MRRLLALLCFVALVAQGCASTRHNPESTLTVSAGSYDRVNVPVSFPLSPGLKGRAVHLETADGQHIPVQNSGDTLGTFILPTLARNTTASFRIVSGGEATPDQFGVQRKGGTVQFTVGGQHLFDYHSEIVPFPRPGIPKKYARGGYIHPVYSPSGVLITDDYSPNHIHQHGIWAAWTLTEFEGRHPDFWNMGDSTGRVEPVGLDEVWQGPVHAGFQSRHRYVDMTAKPEKTALNETWKVTVYNVTGAGGRAYRVFDLIQEQTTATSSPLILPEYRYGGVGMRGHWDWNGEGKTIFLTSEGKDRLNGHATTARWCHMGGLVGGKFVGITMMDHPKNFRHPQPMRIHPSEPFFNYAPSLAGDWAIRPGERYTARYRFVVYDGEPDVADLNRIWNDYAYPPGVVVS